jgi:hypothetical protein
MTESLGRRTVLLMLLFFLASPPRGLSSQIPDSLQALPEIAQEDTLSEDLAPRGISPRGAFIRSGLIPGWGHVKVGAHVRGAFYFTAQSASVFMIFSTQQRINRTEKRLALLEGVVTARLAAEGITDPDQVEDALAEDEQIEDLRLLRETRGAQREDWIALSLFLMLIGGVDGYVSAHLADFPTAVVIEPTPGGGMGIGLSFPLNF